MSIRPELAWRISDQIGHAYALSVGLAGRSLEHLEISVVEFVALVILTEFPAGLTQTRWGALQGVSRQRAHTVTKRLTGLGLVLVSRQGRASTVQASEEGSALVQKEQPALARTAAENMSGLTANEAERLSTLLAKLLSE
jgi:DNA-binding MarR family transcriptional regulator